MYFLFKIFTIFTSKRVTHMRRVFAMFFKLNFLFFQLFLKCLNRLFKPVVKPFQMVVWENQSVCFFMSFLKNLKQFTIIFNTWGSTWTYIAWATWLIISFYNQAYVCRFIFTWWGTWLGDFILIPSNICSSWFSLFLLVAWFLFIAFFVWVISFNVPLFTTTKASIIVRIEITSFHVL